MNTKKFYIAKVGLMTGSERYIELRETYAEAEKDLNENAHDKELDFVDNFTFEVDANGELLRVIDADGCDPKTIEVDYDEYFQTRAWLESEE